MEYGLVVLWLAMYLVVGLAALPLAAALFDGFHDRGAAFAIPLGLATVAVVGFLVGHVSFGWPAVVAGLAVLVVASATLGDAAGVDRRRYLQAATVFAAGFLFMVAVRATDPEIAVLPLEIGEKFLDYGLLRTALRAEALPPEDMWFAGQPVRYHYVGHALVALLTRLTGTAPRYAYNLALAGFYATLLTAAYGLAGAIADARDVPTDLAAGLGAFFVGVAGNLHTAGQVLAWLLPDALVTAVPGLRPGGPAVTWTPTEFWYFAASRVVPVDPANPEGTFEAATEFPLFAWINADMHAHMMSQPFMLLAVGLLLAYWRGGPERRRLVLLAVLPPVVGLVGVTNVWSLPTALGLAALVVYFAPGEGPLAGAWVGAPIRDAVDRLDDAGPMVAEIRRLARSIVLTLVVGTLAIAWTLPFWTGVFLGGPSRSVVYWAPWTPLGPLLIVHGAFLAVIGTALARRLSTDRASPLVVAAVGLAGLATATLAGAPALGLTIPIVAGGWWLLRTREDAGFALVLVVAGAGLVLLVELVSIEGERFNVIFKYYAHVWLFWAIATAVLAAGLLGEYVGERPTLRRDHAGRTAVGVVLAVLVLTGLYAGFAVPSHFASNDPVGADGATLDGTVYTHARYPDEAAAIEWLDAREGQPTIVTAAPGGYRWRPERGQGASAPASLTGLPTVLGWFHERQYRGTEAFQRRERAVRTIYQGSRADQTRLLSTYDVTYVYVGPAERNRYEVTIEDHPALDVAFRAGDVVVYEVPEDPGGGTET